MLDLLIPYWGQIKLALIAAAAAGLFFAGWTVNGWRYESAIADQKAEANRQMAVETAYALKVERERDTIKDELEKAHVKNQAALDAYHDGLSRRIGVLGGLHVPGRGTCSDGSPSPASGTSAVLNAAASECVIDFDFAQRLVDAASQCDGFLELARLGQAYGAEIERERAEIQKKNDGK